MVTIDFWCELASPYAYLSACRIGELATRSGVAVRWRPFSLHPTFKASGWDNSPFVVYPNKGRYMWRDVEREAARLGIAFRKPSAFPRNGVPASKVALLGLERGWGARFIPRAMRANFVEDKDIAAPEVIDAILREMELDGPVVREEATSPERSPALRRSTEEAMRLGIFGAPTFLVGEEMFWGNDRLEQALEWATGGGQRSAGSA
ncbi:MAG TPA: 2-hydroxychromene-2-carboxylate isomerase [Polyangiaceae bacterium]|jgi:2-hydroxychromene-2-carboxylate isomerase